MFAMGSRPRLFVALTLLAGAAGPLAAGPVGGDRYDVHRVQAHSNDVFHLTFYGDEEAAVYVEGDGDTDLDLYVYDENGNLIGSDTDGSDTCLVAWRPNWTGDFRIVVTNRGSVYNEYLISAR